MPDANVRRHLRLTVPSYLLRWLGLHALADRLNWPTVENFDRWLASCVEPCDVFHCLSSFGLRAHRIVKVRYCATTVCDRGSTHIQFQDDLLAAEFDRWGVRYRGTDHRIIEKELAEYRECDLITVPSTFARRSFIDRGVPGEKVVTIPYGVDLAQFRRVEKRDDMFRVLFVGTLSIRKGIPYLLEALAPLRLPRFEFVLIGPKLSEVDPFLRRHAGRFRYLGPKPRRELYRYYSGASVFAIASVEEGLALVMGQAMACGLPVVATPNTGAEDLFTDGVEGFIVPRRSPEAIREKVRALYRNPAVRGAHRRAALDRVKSLGGWDAYGSRVERAYSEARRQPGENIGPENGGVPAAGT